MEYHRLTLQDRYHIEALFNSGLSLREIANKLGHHASTISREIKRNKPPFLNEYKAEIARNFSLQRGVSRHWKKIKIRGETEAYVREKIAQDWSPEQIAGRMRLEKRKDRISYCTIYRYLQRDKVNGGYLWKRLRVLRKQRKDRKNPSWKPTVYMPERIFIKDRPKIVDERKRLGDYERDTLLGKAGGALCLTIVDRTSRLLKLALLPKKCCELVHEATIACLKNEPVKTITNDNGSEFARHYNTAYDLKAQIYFSRAYRAWERGTNENLNGLIRQYLPKHKPIEILSDEDINRIEVLLNTRPRKCLGYKTPFEIHIELKSSDVALDM